jgi:hypothetical protein
MLLWSIKDWKDLLHAKVKPDRKDLLHAKVKPKKKVYPFVI